MFVFGCRSRKMSLSIGRLLGGLTLASLLALATACTSGGSTDPAAVVAATGGSSGEVLNLGDQQQNLENPAPGIGCAGWRPLQGQLHRVRQRAARGRRIRRPPD